MGMWRNGSRGSLKNFCPKGRVGSNPTLPTRFMILNHHLAKGGGFVIHN